MRIDCQIENSDLVCQKMEENQKLNFRIQELEEQNLFLSSRDNVDDYNHGAHMMAKQILKELKHKGYGGFGEPLANEIVTMYHTLREGIEKEVKNFDLEWEKYDKPNFEMHEGLIHKMDLIERLKKVLEKKMTKTYCDRCGKEVKNYAHVHLPDFDKDGKRKRGHDTKSYELCNVCVDKMHEFLKEK